MQGPLASGCPPAWGSLVAPAQDEEEEEHITGRCCALPGSSEPHQPPAQPGLTLAVRMQNGSFPRGVGVEACLSWQRFPTNGFRELHRSVPRVRVALREPDRVPRVCPSGNFILPSDDCTFFYRQGSVLKLPGCP